MADAHPLLELQQLDSSADALRKRCAELPERARLQEAEAEGAGLRAASEASAEQHRILATRLRDAEALVADLDAKAREVERSLYSGSTNVLRELDALQHELGDVRRRKSEHEDAELEVMEQGERLDAEIAATDARRAAVAARAAELHAGIVEEEARTDAELARLAEQRPAIAARIEPALLAAYEALRANPRLGGRAAARLRNGTCGGCSMSLPITAASRIQAAPVGSEPCPGCGRILVP
jgi:predicted  nucleic acid-binding Zn-ribbon protein